MEPPEAAGTTGQFKVTAMRGVVVVTGQVAESVSVTRLPAQMSRPLAVTTEVTEQSLPAGTV